MSWSHSSAIASLVLRDASPDIPAEPTRALTEAMARGDEAAYERFMGQYADRLLYVLLVVHRGDEASAKDCLQATMIRVVRHIRAFDEDEVFWSWLTRLARTASGDYGRKQTRYIRMLTRHAF